MEQWESVDLELKRIPGSNPGSAPHWLLSWLPSAKSLHLFDFSFSSKVIILPSKGQLTS